MKEQLEKLLKATKEMRRLQTLYFKTRSSDVLKAAKSKEKEVDDMIINLSAEYSITTNS